MIIEKASGQSVKDFAKENIFEPLNMKNSHFHDNYLHIVKNRAFSYRQNDVGFDNLIMRFDLVGSGGLYSNIEDLYLWDQNFYNNKLGKGDSEILKIMHEEGVLNNGESTGYAFALHNGNYRGLKTVSHGGSLAGYRTQLMRFPDQNFTVILLANIASFKPKTMAQKVADIYLYDVMDPLEKKTITTKSDQSDKIKTFVVEDLNQYIGTYYSDELDVNYIIYIENHSLFVKIKNIEPFELKATKIDTFTNRLELVFTRDQKNTITGFLVNAGRVQNLAFKKEK